MPAESRVVAPRGPDDAPRPVEPADADGALIEWMLGLDATRRLEVAQGFADSVEAMRHARRD